MNKKEFLSKLDKELKKVENAEKASILEFYNNFIEDAINENQDEEMVVENLGSIDKIVNKIKSEYHLKKFNEEQKVESLVMAIISLFKRIPFIESFKTSLNVTGKLLGFSITTIILYLLAIVTFLVGTTSSIIFLYSSTVISGMGFQTANPIIIGLIIFLTFLIVPIISLVGIYIISKSIKMFIKVLKSSKRSNEKLITSLIFVIGLPLVLIIYNILVDKILDAFVIINDFVYLESVAIIILGVTAILIYLILSFSKIIGNKISKSLNSILKRLEGEI